MITNLGRCSEQCYHSIRLPPLSVPMQTMLPPAPAKHGSPLHHATFCWPATDPRLIPRVRPVSPTLLPSLPPLLPPFTLSAKCESPLALRLRVLSWRYCGLCLDHFSCANLLEYSWNLSERPSPPLPLPRTTGG